MLSPALRERLLAVPDGPLDVVVDTDVTNEIDDQFALAWALRRPDRLRVQALYACPYSLGEQGFAAPGLVTDLERASVLARRDERRVTPAEGMALAAQECRRIAALAQSDVPVLEGAPRYLPDAGTPVSSPAAEHLVELAHQDRERPLHVLGIGCATNLASALLLDPSIAEHVVMVWTASYPSFWPYPNAGYNMVQDLPAARVLFDSGVPLVYLPGYYVGEQLRVGLPELREHLRGRGPLAAYLLELAETSVFLGPDPGATKVIWDLVDVAYALDPALLSTRLVRSPVLGEDLRFRETGTDRHLVREAHGVQRDAVFAGLYSAVTD